jgi:Kef-type K+ transport system membrane component KefB
MPLKTELLVLVEVAVIIAASRLLGMACRWIKQPLVIGEIIAGILLGPSLLGMLAPQFTVILFPSDAIPFLKILSEIGLIFFMFLIGLELNPSYLKGQIKVAVVISQASIVLPFFMGIVLAGFLYPIVSDPTVNPLAFALFLGSAMSITAFPVLARILTENNLQNTRLGTLALTCAAVDDLTAWCLLAVAIAVTRTNSFVGAIPTIVAALLYVSFMFSVGRLGLEKLARIYNRTKRMTPPMLTAIYLGVLASALVTELIGIHLIFGAFLLGAVMPKQANLVREIAEKTEDFVLIFLLPIFFAYSGLRTQIGSINKPHLWLICGLVLVVAVTGKFMGSYVAARICKLPNRDAVALGALMNTRGLTELILLNIGLDLKVISKEMFTILVIMALVTTFMTSPWLEWIYPKQMLRDEQTLESEPGQLMESAPLSRSTYRILVPVANPQTQFGLIQLATAIARPTPVSPNVSPNVSPGVSPDSSPDLLLGLSIPSLPASPPRDASPSPAPISALIGMDEVEAIGKPGAMVHPLSLIEMEEDYAYRSTPMEANRRIDQRLGELQTLVNTLDPQVRPWVQPIVQATVDVSRQTALITLQKAIDLVLVGWHRPALSTNRLGGRVGQMLSSVPTDLAVFVDQGLTTLQHILVPYANTSHDDLAVELATRLLIHQPQAQLTILYAPTAGCSASEMPSFELRQLLDRLPKGLGDRLCCGALAAEEPMQAVVLASADYDLTIAGANQEWGIERQTLGRYTDELANYCRSSLLITRRYNRISAHLQSLSQDT